MDVDQSPALTDAFLMLLADLVAYAHLGTTVCGGLGRGYGPGHGRGHGRPLAVAIEIAVAVAVAVGV